MNVVELGQSAGVREARGSTELNRGGNDLGFDALEGSRENATM